ATAIYGSRGANGVVLITTKKGKAGQTAVDVNIYSGVGQVTRTLPLLNTQQYLAMRHEAFKNDGATPDPSYDYDITGAWDTTRYTDWQKVLIGGTAHFTNAQMSLSGGTANTQFRIGGGYSKQTTVFPGDYADEKASTHVNINHSSTDQKFKILFSAQYVYDYNVLPRTDFTGLIILAPDAPALYNSDGSVNFQNGTFSNPMVVALQKATATSNNLISNLNLSYQILPGLQLRSSFGYTHYEMNQSDQRPATAFYGPPIAARRENAFGNSAVNTWIIEPQISYNRKLGSGKLDVLIGSTVQRNQTNATGFDATNFLNDASIPNVAAAASLTTVGNDYSEYRYNALYARLNYNLEDKYIINLTGRRDGSSRFGPGKQFGNFGAIGGAWVFSKEKFIENELSFLSFGKLRASYGTTGNDQITNYQYLSAYANQGGLPYQGVTGLTPNRIANPYFAWEVNKKLEAALELGFLKDRINIEASYYRNRTGNQLVGYPLPAIDGFNTIQFNLPAVVQNTGLELTLNTVNVISKNFRWNSSFNISMPRNKLVSYPNIANSAYAGTYEVGQSLFIKNLYHSLGVDPQTGIYQFRDVNNDGQFSNPADLQFEKQLAQNYFGGFQNTFSYKQWSVDIFFQFVKQTGLSYLGSFDAPGMFNVNQPDYVLSRWQKPGDNTNVALFSPNYAQDPNFLLGQSNAIISDASFIRLKNLSISYSFPDKWKRGLSLKNARIYLQAQNLFTITSYKGLDPETQGLLLPPLRMITTGIQLSL
ncbi:MAG: hypothetical protein JWM28_1586, partial [Chitinophagaceae bacterium]|nr:hypothetical protein [Chitinophagaceae bacterium]